MVVQRMKRTKAKKRGGCLGAPQVLRWSAGQLAVAVRGEPGSGPVQAWVPYLRYDYGPSQ